jgi:hypothetical protein
MPRLAAQREEYLEAAMNANRHYTRTGGDTSLMAAARSPAAAPFPSDAKTPRRPTSGVGGLRNSPFLHLRARTVLGLLPPSSVRLGASPWGPLAPPPGFRRVADGPQRA